MISNNYNITPGSVRYAASKDTIVIVFIGGPSPFGEFKIKTFSIMTVEGVTKEQDKEVTDFWLARETTPLTDKGLQFIYDETNWLSFTGSERLKTILDEVYSESIRL